MLFCRAKAPWERMLGSTVIHSADWARGGNSSSRSAASRMDRVSDIFGRGVVICCRKQVVHVEVAEVGTEERKRSSKLAKSLVGWGNTSLHVVYMQGPPTRFSISMSEVIVTNAARICSRTETDACSSSTDTPIRDIAKFAMGG